MRSFFYLFSLCLIVFFLNNGAFAHQEPAKTNKEKQDKVKHKSKIFTAKIKTLTSWNYEIISGKATEKKTRLQHEEYDKTGNLTGVSAYRNDSLIERVEYTYSTNHDLLTDIDFSPEGIILEKNIFKYDNQGRVISGESVNGRDQLTSKFNNKFNRVNKTIEFSKYNKNDSLEYKILYVYKNDFDKFDYHESVKTDASGKQILKVEKKFSPDKLIIEKKITGLNNEDNCTFEYQYNAKKDYKELIKKNSKGSVEWRQEYFYQQDGNLYEIKQFNANGEIISDIKYTYEFYK